MTKILVVEDDELTRISLNSLLSKKGEVLLASSKDEALSALASSPEVAFFDLDLEEDLQGLELISEGKKKKAYVVVLTGREEEEVIEKAYGLGCDDYLVKPFKNDELELVFKKFSLFRNQDLYRGIFSSRYVTQDERFLKSLEVLNEALVSDRPITIRGETGTGKTLIAKLIHEISHGGDEKFVHLSCAELPENLLESELFGFEKGAFSGAEKKTKGKMELADGGTLFLDEIATMPMTLQQKLLRAIEEKSFYPLGSEKKISSNFRLLSATCENLEEMVKEGKFREDLYYRIDGFKMNLPPLRERKGDIHFLIKHFMRKTPRRVVLSDDVKTFFNDYSWPGNIRELEKTIEILKTKSKGIIKQTDLPSYMRGVTTSEDDSLLSRDLIDFIRSNGLKAFVEMMEEKALLHFQKEHDGKVRKILNDLKISNSSFYRVLERLKGKGEGE